MKMEHNISFKHSNHTQEWSVIIANNGHDCNSHSEIEEIIKFKYKGKKG